MDKIWIETFYPILVENLEWANPENRTLETIKIIIKIYLNTTSNDWRWIDYVFSGLDHNKSRFEVYAKLINELLRQGYMGYPTLERHEFKEVFIDAIKRVIEEKEIKPSMSWKMGHDNTIFQEIKKLEYKRFKYEESRLYSLGILSPNPSDEGMEIEAKPRLSEKQEWWNFLFGEGGENK